MSAKHDYPLDKAPVAVEAPRHRSSKDTKRWCRGNVGVAHDSLWVITARLYSRFAELRCQRCGRKLDYFFRWDHQAGMTLEQNVARLNAELARP